MSAELKAKLAQVASRLAATQERLRGLERSAASLRHDLESLRTEVEQGADSGAAIDADEFGHRVPTQPLSVGSRGLASPLGAAGDLDGTPVEPREPQGAAAPPASPSLSDDEPWPER